MSSALYETEEDEKQFSVRSCSFPLQVGDTTANRSENVAFRWITLVNGNRQDSVTA